MASYESYWVAVATAAPVIALANAVSLGDSYRMQQFFSDLQGHPHPEIKEFISSSMHLAQVTLRLGNSNFLSQTLAFATALIYLAVGSAAVWPVGFTVILETYGLYILLKINISAGRLHYLFDKFGAAMDKAGYADTVTEAFTEILSKPGKASDQQATNLPTLRGRSMRTPPGRHWSRWRRQ